MIEAGSDREREGRHNHRLLNSSHGQYLFGCDGANGSSAAPERTEVVTTVANPEETAGAALAEMARTTLLAPTPTPRFVKKLLKRSTALLTLFCAASSGTPSQRQMAIHQLSKRIFGPCLRIGLEQL